MFKKFSLRKRMYVFIIGANLIVLLAIFFIYLNFSRNIIIRETKEKAMEKVRGVVSTFGGDLGKKSQIAWTLSKNPMIIDWLNTNDRRHVTSDADKIFKNIIENCKNAVAADGEIATVFLVSEKTQWYYDSMERTIPDDWVLKTRQWYIDAAKDEKPSWQVTVDHINHNVGINFMHNIYMNDRLIGMCGVDLYLDNLEKYISNLSEAFNTGQVFIVGNDGTLLYHPQQSYILSKKITDFADDGIAFRNMKNASQRLIHEKEGIVVVTFEGDKRYFIYTKVPSLDWTVVLSVAASEINQPITFLVIYSILIMIVASFLFVIIIHFLVRSIANPLNNLVAMLKHVAKGEADLTKRLQVNSEDELGQLAFWFNDFVDNLHDLILNVRDNVDEIVQASEILRNTTESMNRGAEDQAAITSNISCSTSEMSTTINETSRIYNQAVEVVKKASSKAREGDEIVKTSVMRMEKIAGSVEKSHQTIHELNSRSDEIGKVIQVIDDIAKQTNLLALNARIEAAKAHDEKGFSMVAEQIRKLAVHTSESTNEIRKIINLIQNDMVLVVGTMQEGIQEVKNSTDLMQDSESVLSDILLNVGEIQNVISELSSASEQMASASEEISQNTKKIDVVTSENVNSTKNFSDIALQLKEKADTLNKKIKRFTL